MRYLMRLNAEKGSAKKVDIPGYYVGGKTGTAEKVVNGHYSKTKLLTTFMAVLPADQPRYLVTIILDEPQPTPETKGYATSGWNAAPTAGLVVERIAPMLGITPRFDLPTADRQILAVTSGITVKHVDHSVHAPCGARHKDEKPRHEAFRPRDR